MAFEKKYDNTTMPFPVPSSMWTEIDWSDVDVFWVSIMGPIMTVVTWILVAGAYSVYLLLSGG